MESRLAKVDAFLESPSMRAGRVFKAFSTITSATHWDMLCFCIEYLGGASLANPFLEEPAKQLAQRLYYAHYYKAKELGILTPEQIAKWDTLPPPPQSPK